MLPIRDRRRPRRRLVSFATYMVAQRALLPVGDEAAWIARHAADFRAWVEARFTIVPHGGTVSVEMLLTHVPDRFRALVDA